MSISYAEKLKLIRYSEQLTKKEVTNLIGINYTTYHSYESGKANMSLESMVKMFGHPRFNKYQDWFMYDKIDPARGQIAPLLAHSMQEKTTSSR